MVVSRRAFTAASLLAVFGTSPRVLAHIAVHRSLRCPIDQKEFGTFATASYTTFGSYGVERGLTTLWSFAVSTRE
jgi:hypothetical protein